MTQTFLRHAPRALRPWVRGITHYAADTGATYLEPATLTVPLIFTFGAPWRIGIGDATGAFGHFVGGLTTGPVRVAGQGAVECLQIDLTLPGALRLLGGRTKDVAGRCVPVEDLDDPGASALARRMEATDDPVRRLSLADAWIGGRLAETALPEGPVAQALALILRGGGRLSVGRIADRTGLSRQTLHARIADATGLGPKALSRVARFERAGRLIPRATGWADLAALAGYADEAHLSREFRALSGQAPGRWAA